MLGRGVRRCICPGRLAFPRMRALPRLCAQFHAGRDVATVAVLVAADLAVAVALALARQLAPLVAALAAAAAAVVVLVLVIVEQGATMGIPGSGNSRELSGIPGSDFSLPGSETWENRQNPPVTVDAADAFCTMGRIWPSRCPRRMSYGPKVP